MAMYAGKSRQVIVYFYPRAGGKQVRYFHERAGKLILMMASVLVVELRVVSPRRMPCILVQGMNITR